MTAAGREAQAQRNEVPANRASHWAEYDACSHDVCFDDTLTHRYSHMQAEKEKGYEVEKGGPGNGIMRPQHQCGYHSCNGIGGIVQAIQRLEQQRYGIEAQEQVKR